MSALALLGNLNNYRGFVLSSVQREFQLKYRNSLLGALWTVLSPLAMIVVYTVVFAQVMHSRLPGTSSTFAYSIYLCAGVLTWGKVWELSEEQFTDVVDINLVGAWKTLKATIPAMLEAANGGSITVISSVAGLKAMPMQASYSASKYGLVGLTQTTAKELGHHRIRVNSVHPYAVDTPMGVADTEAHRIFGIPWVNPHFTSILDYHPVAALDEISDAVLYLASDSAKGITAAEFQIDMGHSKV